VETAAIGKSSGDVAVVPMYCFRRKRYRGAARAFGGDLADFTGWRGLPGSESDSENILVDRGGKQPDVVKQERFSSWKVTAHYFATSI
jgi:hypothetical protein